MIARTLVTGLFISTSEAANTAGVVHLPLKHTNFQNGLSKRDFVSQNLIDYSYQITADLQVGSNNQSVEVIVGTDSDSLWVMSSSNPLCSYVGDNVNEVVDNLQTSVTDGKIACNSKWLFNPSQSTSFSRTNDPFKYGLSIPQYDFVAVAQGSYAYDDISYGGQRISQAIFAVADQSNLTGPSWGIGISSSETIPKLMKDQGIISHNAYSVWLSSPASNTSELIFGGVDTSKYNGVLQTLPLVYDPTVESQPSEFSVILNSIGVFQGSASANIVECAMPATVGLGGPYMVLPADFLNAILSSVGGSGSSNNYKLPCNTPGGLIFNVSGIEVSVPFSELIVPSSTPDAALCSTRFILQDGKINLGIPFMRSAYTVFDLDNFEISIASPKAEDSVANVIPLSGTVPGAQKAPGYYQTASATNYAIRVVDLTNTPSYPSLPYTMIPITHSTSQESALATSTTSSAATFRGGGLVLATDPAPSRASSTSSSTSSTTTTTTTSSSSSRNTDTGKALSHTANPMIVDHSAEPSSQSSVKWMTTESSTKPAKGDKEDKSSQSASSTLSVTAAGSSTSSHAASSAIISSTSNSSAPGTKNGALKAAPAAIFGIVLLI